MKKYIVIQESEGSGSRRTILDKNLTKKQAKTLAKKHPTSFDSGTVYKTVIRTQSS